MDAFPFPLALLLKQAHKRGRIGASMDTETPDGRRDRFCFN